MSEDERMLQLWSLDVSTRKKTSACDSMVPLDQLSGIDDNDLERHTDLLGQRYLPHRLRFTYPVQVLSGSVLPSASGNGLERKRHDIVTPALYHLDHRLAMGMAWHFLFMWIFFVNGLLYVLYTAISGEWRYLLPNRRTFGDAVQVVLHDLHIRKRPLPRRKFNGAQQIAYTSVIIMGAGSLVTGLAVYKPTQFAFIDILVGGYMNARFIHFWLTMGYIAFFMVHITQVIRAGWNNFRAMVTGYELAPVEPPVEEPAR